MGTKPRIELVDTFTTESGKRIIQLTKVIGLNIKYPWVIEVYLRRVDAKPIFISSAEYMDEEVARKDFETRRPQMREETVDMPMQKGKRLIQEVMQEKLGDA